MTIVTTEDVVNYTNIKDIAMNKDTIKFDL